MQYSALCTTWEKFQPGALAVLHLPLYLTYQLEPGVIFFKYLSWDKKNKTWQTGRGEPFETNSIECWKKNMKWKEFLLLFITTFRKWFEKIYTLLGNSSHCENVLFQKFQEKCYIKNSFVEIFSTVFIRLYGQSHQIICIVVFACTANILSAESTDECLRNKSKDN